MSKSDYKTYKNINVTINHDFLLPSCGYHDFKVIKGISSERILDYFSIHFVIEGKGYYRIGKKTHNVEKGDFFFLFPNESLSYYPNEKEPWKYYWMNFHLDNVNNFFDLMGVSPNTPIKKAPDYDSMLNLFENLFNKNLSANKKTYKATSIFYEILSLFAEETKNINLTNNLSVSNRVKDLIALNYTNPEFNIPLIANIMNISHSYLCKLFKEQTNTTIVNYLVNYRLNKSLEILKEEKCLIKDVVSKVGFNDELHFMKIFKKKYNLTVKEYQRIHNPDIET